MFFSDDDGGMFREGTVGGYVVLSTNRHMEGQDWLKCVMEGQDWLKCVMEGIASKVGAYKPCSSFAGLGGVQRQGLGTWDIGDAFVMESSRRRQEEFLQHVHDSSTP